MPYSQITSDEALSRLMEGNKRFVEGNPTLKTFGTPEQRINLADYGQTPFAIVLGCADSRVPAEYVFDVGFGDLFVVRVAGNIVAPSLLGSIEFAASNFRTPLCIVLGHTRCGAVYAATEAVKLKKPAPTDHIFQIVDAITPSVQTVIDENSNELDTDAIADQAIRLNVQVSMQQILERSHVVRSLADSGAFKVVGGVYDLHSGKVEMIPFK